MIRSVVVGFQELIGFYWIRPAFYGNAQQGSRSGFSSNIV